MTAGSCCPMGTTLNAPLRRWSPAVEAPGGARSRSGRRCSGRPPARARAAAIVRTVGGVPSVEHRELCTGATVVKSTTLLPWSVTMARPIVGPGTGMVVTAAGSVTTPGMGSTATVDVSRSTATAKSPLGDTVRSVGALGSGIVVSVPVGERVDRDVRQAVAANERVRAVGGERDVGRARKRPARPRSRLPAASGRCPARRRASRRRSPPSASRACVDGRRRRCRHRPAPALGGRPTSGSWRTTVRRSVLQIDDRDAVLRSPRRRACRPLENATSTGRYPTARSVEGAGAGIGHRRGEVHHGERTGIPGWVGVVDERRVRPGDGPVAARRDGPGVRVLPWTGYVCVVSVPWALTRRRVASSERTLRTMATSSVGWTASATAARYVGPLPAGVVWTLKVDALMYATRPLVGLAVQTKLPVATGALNLFSALISGGRAASPRRTRSEPLVLAPPAAAGSAVVVPRGGRVGAKAAVRSCWLLQPSVAKQAQSDQRLRRDAMRSSVFSSPWSSARRLSPRADRRGCCKLMPSRGNAKNPAWFVRRRRRWCRGWRNMAPHRTSRHTGPCTRVLSGASILSGAPKCGSRALVRHGSGGAGIEPRERRPRPLGALRDATLREPAIDEGTVHASSDDPGWT